MSLHARSNASSSNSDATHTSTAKIVSTPSQIPPGYCLLFVTVEVGAEKKIYSIRKDLLVFYSDYFRAAFNGSFAEATERKISLLQERVDVFNVFNKFIYTRCLSDETDTEISWELLIRVWLFGDRHLIPALQNHVMNTMIEKSAKEKVIPNQHLNLIYKNTLIGSPLRKILVDWIAYETDMPD
ncbi:hypothetical protein QM012_003626 [Aureobasidium pullulans]|uniref:BTB domain-containing protein n=1 Tax=Aureobasidium pullulans TaxID=5580 RepID=A0ABR0T8S2_AURPU